jgi:hypothetical protein
MHARGHAHRNLSEARGSERRTRRESANSRSVGSQTVRTVSVSFAFWKEI